MLSKELRKQLDDAINTSGTIFSNISMTRQVIGSLMDLNTKTNDPNSLQEINHCLCDCMLQLLYLIEKMQRQRVRYAENFIKTGKLK